MRILVTGITGYVGRLLADALTREGHDVVGLARHPERAPLPYPVRAVDLTDGRGLADAIDGADVAYYLVHSMEGTRDYAAAELAAARRFAVAAADAGVQRIVYMSVLTPADAGRASGHVRSRVAVEKALAATDVPVVALRASIVIGTDSRSFRFLLRLVERMPVLLLPPWRSRRTCPIDERDLLAQLVDAATATLHAPLTVHDAAGPDEVSYQELIERIRDHLLIGRPVMPLPIALTGIAAPVAAAIAGEDLGLVAPLMQSLGTDLLPRPDHQDIALRPPRHDLDAAIEHALRGADEVGD
ncbi:MAG: NAD(P)H-binding protein [Solirubrobacteraceae bacterium]|nr:NAD(P)H-binding protein [Solirubrobacteraceae bacterium]